MYCRRLCRLVFFFFNDTATTEIYTLSLHDALPISPPPGYCRPRSSPAPAAPDRRGDRKSTRLNSSHTVHSYAVFCLKKNKNTIEPDARQEKRDTRENAQKQHVKY